MAHDLVGKDRCFTVRQVFAGSIQVCAALAFCSSVGCSNGTSTQPAVPSPGYVMSPGDLTPALAETSNQLESMQAGEHTHPVTSDAHAHGEHALHCEVAGEHVTGEHAAAEHVLHCAHVACEHVPGEPVAGEHAHDADVLHCEHVGGEVAGEPVAGEQVHDVYLHCVHHVAGEPAHGVHLHCKHFVGEHVVDGQAHDADVLHCEAVSS